MGAVTFELVGGFVTWKQSRITMTNEAGAEAFAEPLVTTPRIYGKDTVGGIGPVWVHEDEWIGRRD